MSLRLYSHPLSSFCQKVLIALYENATPFEQHVVLFEDEASAAALRKLWPIGKIPVLRDDARERTVPESSTIIEYLAQHYPGPVQLVPADADQARQTRLRDRFYDLYVQGPMQKIVGDRLRPEGQRDPYGVEQARAQLETAYRIVDEDMATRTWAMGDSFTMADCAAGPALYYANLVAPLVGAHPHVTAYLNRLAGRPSFSRAIEEAGPYRARFPR